MMTATSQLNWSLVSAPEGVNPPVIVSPNAAVTNVTGLGRNGNWFFLLLIVKNMP